MTTNPTHGWIYEQFYKPFETGKQEPHRKFIESLFSDNKHLSKHYESVLDSLDDISRKRLKLGDWNYLDDPSMLVDYDAIDDLFTNDHVKKTGVRKLSADLAMKGRDKFVAAMIDGEVITIEVDKAKSDGKDIETTLRGLMTEYSIGHTNVIADSDGLGAFLESYIKNIKEFRGGAKPTSREYNNLKSQCGFKLAEKINKRELKIDCAVEQRAEIKKQLLNCLKRDRVDIDDTKKKLISKEKQKEHLGHSPDYFDALMMLMYFYLKKSYF